MTDSELLKAVDDHEADCNATEASMLESMIRQADAGRALSEKQRAWLEALLDQLDERSA